MVARPRPALLAALAAVALGIPALASAAATSSSYFVGPVDMLASAGVTSRNYVGDMPDASVYYENGTYYAYTTSSGGSFVPVYTSTDGMRTWQTRSSYPPPATADNGTPVRQDPVFNDGLVGLATWAQPNPGPNFTPGAPCPTPKTNGCTHVVSPSVVKLASGKYLMAYGTWAKSGAYVRMGVTTAIGASPAGPFTDHSSAPIYVGPYTEGSIDPQLFTDPATGRIYVSWMNQGNPSGAPRDSIVYNQEITVDALGRATKIGAAKNLLSTSGAQPWEQDARGYGTVVEQPSMVSYRGRYYLFYSAQLWTSAKYRMGYATCAGPAGPCTRAATSTNPLVTPSAEWNQDGPGGGSAFVDAAGRLRVVYGAWAYGKVGYSAANPYVKSTPDRQRFGHVATLDQDGAGQLFVAQRSLAQAPTGCSSPDLFPTGNWVDMSMCQYPALGPKVGRDAGAPDAYVRVDGLDPYSVSAAASRRGFPNGASEVVVASGQAFPDALAAGTYSAGAMPVILVPPTGALPATVAAELRRLRPATTTIAGGVGAVSAAMETAIRQVTGSTRRLAGADRYATAAALGVRPTGSTVYVASGANFPDALAGGVVASRQQAPVLLTAATSVPAATRTAILDRIRAHGVRSIAVLGGTGVVSSVVEAQLRAIAPGATVTRLAGADRYATATAVDRGGFPNPGASVVLAGGNDFAGALAAVPLAVRTGAELLLTGLGCLPAVTSIEIGRQRPPLTTAIGRTSVVSDRALLHGRC